MYFFNVFIFFLFFVLFFSLNFVHFNKELWELMVSEERLFSSKGACDQKGDTRTSTYMYIRRVFMRNHAMIRPDIYPVHRWQKSGRFYSDLRNKGNSGTYVLSASKSSRFTKLVQPKSYLTTTVETPVKQSLSRK